MKRHLLLVLAALGVLFCQNGPARAQKAVFTAEQREAIIGVVRQALKDDPTILTEALQSLRQKVMSEQQAHSLEAVRKNWASLRVAPGYAVKGDPHGAVTVVEFLDPRCSYCRKMMPVVDGFLAAHRDVRLVEKIVPVLGSGSVTAAQAIFAAADQNRYDAMRRAVMTDTAPPTAQRMIALAKENGLDVARFATDMQSRQVRAIMADNLSQARAIGLDGTPTFLFGQAAMVPGALSPAQMDQLLGEARKR